MSNKNQILVFVQSHDNFRPISIHYLRKTAGNYPVFILLNISLLVNYFTNKLMIMEDNKTFKIGLCMAGAISAGAYTAGVMDYLIEALEEWDKRKNEGTENTPSHNVEISVIGGASAGGMTGIITAAALNDTIIPIKKLEDSKKMSQNKLYDSWVNLVADDMLLELLNTEDIEKSGLISALNSSFIDRIASKAVKVVNDVPLKRDYFSADLKIFVTLSNLNGMSYNVSFNSSSPNLNNYIITAHNDYACFKLANSQDDYNKDGWIPLNFFKEINSEIAKNAAMATGAFPVGLKARELNRDGQYLNDLSWFDHITKDAKRPFPKPYTTINIDGGLINNEPFENVKNVLSPNNKLETDHNKIENTILMIDPFPSEQTDFNGTTSLFSIIKNTIGTMTDQSRIKPSSLIDALDDNHYGQFLIAPVRGNIVGSKAIACGSLDGFGGFVSKEFRIHDFFLGRANCEKFLRDHFTIPANTQNPIFKNSYSQISDITKFTSKNGDFQIIPLFNPPSDDYYMPVFSNGSTWPTVTTDYLMSYKPLLKKRIQKILFNTSNYNNTQRVLLWFGAKLILNKKIANSVLSVVKDSLIKHKSIIK